MKRQLYKTGLKIKDHRAGRRLIVEHIFRLYNLICPKPSTIEIYPSYFKGAAHQFINYEFRVTQINSNEAENTFFTKITYILDKKIFKFT